MTCGSEPDDFYLTDDDRCSGCGYGFEVAEVETLGFVMEESGVQPGTPDCPPVHWATGYIVCPQCGVQLPYEVSS